MLLVLLKILYITQRGIGLGSLTWRRTWKSWVLIPFFHCGFGPTHRELTKEFTSLMISLQLPPIFQASSSSKTLSGKPNLCSGKLISFLDIDPKKRKRIEINIPFLFIHFQKKIALTSG